ncbi:MAG: hypothetical protein KGL74_13320, partial [Elusimicrobia bacterium]|nr:hypothetical protein [Elusimicrobiota bacterium]
MIFDWLNATWFLLGTICLVLSAVFAVRPDAVSVADRFIGRVERLGVRRLMAAGLYVPILLALGNVARFHIYYLTALSGMSANVAWNVAHGYGLRTSVYGDMTYFASHFAFAGALFAPFFWIWNSAGVLATAHGVMLGLIPLALFALARRQSRSSLVPWIIFLLVLAHPKFQELTGTV